MSDQIVLEASGLCKVFGGIRALDCVDVCVEEGEIHGLIGPNGAGKTTFFNIITGFYRSDGGSLTFRGEDISQATPAELAQRGVTRTFQNLQLFEEMTVAEHVMVGHHRHGNAGFVAGLLGTRQARQEHQRAIQTVKATLERFDLLNLADEFATELPLGHQRRVELARAMALEPQVLLLDEPASGLNAVEAAELMELIRSIRSGGTTVLLVEHDMPVMMGLADMITVFDFGVSIARGTPDEVRQMPQVIAAYLGEETDD